jgi:flagellar hook assembly protein FlgD
VADHAAPVRLSFFDVAGRQVATLVDEHQSAGDHQAVWDGRDARGRRVASGVNVYRLQSGSEVGARRMLRLE